MRGDGGSAPLLMAAFRTSSGETASSAQGAALKNGACGVARTSRTPGNTAATASPPNAAPSVAAPASPAPEFRR